MSDDSKFYIHPAAIVETTAIGEDSRVWAFAHIMKDVTIGARCNVGDHSFIESSVSIGDEVTIKNGVSIWQGVRIGDRVFVGPNVAFTNDKRPRSRVYHEEALETIVKEGTSIGANATILPGITLGRYCLIGAGSVVTKSVRDFELVRGNPARHAGWVDLQGETLNFVDGAASSGRHRFELRGEKVIVNQID